MNEDERVKVYQQIYDLTVLNNKKDKEIERLNNIINKAIEYIEKWQSFQHTNGSTHEELRNLKSILKGE